MIDKTIVEREYQARRNFDALCRYRMLDAYGLSVFHSDVDRVWCVVNGEVEKDVLRRFDQLQASGDLQLGSSGGHKVPRWIVAAFGSTSSKQARSYRGRLPGGLAGDQFILHRLFCDGVTRELVIEQDVDKFSAVDVVGVIPHIVEVWRNWRRKTKTDPFETAKLLKKAGLEIW